MNWIVVAWLAMVATALVWEGRRRKESTQLMLMALTGVTIALDKLRDGKENALADFLLVQRRKALSDAMTAYNAGRRGQEIGPLMARESDLVELWTRGRQDSLAHDLEEHAGRLALVMPRHRVDDFGGASISADWPGWGHLDRLLGVLQRLERTKNQAREAVAEAAAARL